MRITPMDIQQQQFRVRFRGFDMQEVDSFLEVVATELKELLHDNSSLRDEAKRLQDSIANYEEKEKTFQSAFVSAQRVVDDMKENAERQRKLVVAQAELEAERIIQRARIQVGQMQEEINRLKQRQVHIEYRTKAFIESLSAWFATEKQTYGPPEGPESLPDDARLADPVVTDGQAADTGRASEAMDSIKDMMSEVDLQGPDSAR